MKKTINKYHFLLIGIIAIAGVIFWGKNSFSQVKGYELDLVLDKSQLRKTASKRHLAYWRMDDKNMGPWDTMRLAKDCDKMTIDQIDKKLGKKAKYSEKSKLNLDGKEYDEISDEIFAKNKDKVKDVIKIKNLEEGAYLIKETDESFKSCKAKDKLTTRIEYLGKESAPDRILELEAN